MNPILVVLFFENSDKKNEVGCISLFATLVYSG